MRWNKKQAIEKFNKTKRLFLENINTDDTSIASLINEERIRTRLQISEVKEGMSLRYYRH